MKKADYSIASPEERDKVIAILHRNANHLIEQQAQDPHKLRSIVSALGDRIRAGEVITGKDFDRLVSLFQKKPIF